LHIFDAFHARNCHIICIVQHFYKVPVTESTPTEMMDPAQLDSLLQNYGIAAGFIEFSGNIAATPRENRLHILNMMGIGVDSPDQLQTLLLGRELAPWLQCLPPVMVQAEGESGAVLVLAAMNDAVQVHWRLLPEQGEAVSGSAVRPSLPLVSTHTAGGRVFEQRWLALPLLPPGYHTLEVSQGESHCSCLLIVAPHRTWQAPVLLTGRVWGLSTQLYSIRSAANWGIGDFADLRQLIGKASAAGAHFVLLNPLHALDLRYPENASPYSPSDRRFLNPLYIALPDCEEYHDAAVQALAALPEQQKTLAALRSADLVDYTGVNAVKLAVLKRMYAVFAVGCRQANNDRARAYHNFVARGGSALQVFAACQAELLFDCAIGREPGFHLYLQWLADTQLQACQQLALELGMPLGLVRDLAVGSSVDGCEVATNRQLFCTAARIGAPPDNFNPEGQNWGLPPLHPEALWQDRFSLFIALLRSNMQHCGALRIDHVMALMRLWWCPDDGSNAAGAYVHYPVDVLFAILRLESVRNRCVIIGEDLGVVPPEIRTYLDGGGIYSNCVFYFEKYDGWHFRKPEHYKPQALAMIANHDVPPLAAWWNSSDLGLRRSIGLIPDDATLLAAEQFRAGEKGQLLQWLDEQGLLPSPWQDRDCTRGLDATLAQAVVRACARVESKLLSLQLDDLAGADTPVNIPGTSTEYPNWRRKIPGTLDTIFSGTGAIGMLQALQEARTA